MKNIPEVRVGLVAVSRDCFPLSLSQIRTEKLKEAYESKYEPLLVTDTIVQFESDVPKVINELRQKDCNALVVYLGNFGPEGPETLLAQRFEGPVMFCAAAEERSNNLCSARGDAYCGLLNASYNLGLRSIRAYIPSSPVARADRLADMIFGFKKIARAIIGVKNLKIISFGPRPQDFLACNAPIKPLYDLGIVSVQENSELDLLAYFRRHSGDPRIQKIADEMAQEIGHTPPKNVLTAMAQYELTLLDWIEENKGAAQYVAFANKCWPAFAGEFGFVPCYVNGRMASKGIPIACEVDIYGALSEYMALCVSLKTPMLLDINNTVPEDMYEQTIAGRYPYTSEDVFMAFHCGNGSVNCMANGQFTHHAMLKLGSDPALGTYEGNIKPGDVTLFRLHGTADGKLCSYMAQGEVLPVDARSFGTIGVFGISDMLRFYRNVLVEKHYPHHCAVAFGKLGSALFEAVKMLGVTDIEYNRSKGNLYTCENPFGE